MLAEIGAPSEDGGAGIFFLLELLLHGGEEELFVGIAIFGEILQSGADCGNFVCYFGGLGCGFLELILEEVALDLIVVDADGNDDDGKGVIAGDEAAADFLGGVAQAVDGEEGVGASDDEKGEEPGEGDGEEAADFFGVGGGLRVVRGRGSGVLEWS